MSRHSPRCAPVCRGGQPRSERFSPFPAPPERLAYGTSFKTSTPGPAGMASPRPSPRPCGRRGSRGTAGCRSLPPACGRGRSPRGHHPFRGAEDRALDARHVLVARERVRRHVDEAAEEGDAEAQRVTARVCRRSPRRWKPKPPPSARRRADGRWVPTPSFGRTPPNDRITSRRCPRRSSTLRAGVFGSNSATPTTPLSPRTERRPRSYAQESGTWSFHREAFRQPCPSSTADGWPSKKRQAPFLGTKAKAAGNSDSLDLQPPRPPPTLPCSGLGRKGNLAFLSRTPRPLPTLRPFCFSCLSRERETGGRSTVLTTE